MANMTVPARFKEASIAATVIRCTCAANEQSHTGAPCPRGRSEPLGVISYYHKNPLKRWLWAARHKGAK